MKLSNETYFSLNFMARKSRPNKEGEIPVLLRITMNGQRTEIYTNRYVKHTIPVEIKPLPELPTTFVPEPTPKRGRPRKFQ